ALAISIYPEDKQDIIDFFGGYQDILNKKVRILHNRSFIDDPTRILRAIRFEQRFGFLIERHTLKLLKEAVSLKMLEKLSAHRLRDELTLVFKEENVIKVIQRIDELVSWNNLISELKLNKRKIKFLNSIKRIIEWYNKSFPHKRKLDSWLMYLLGLLDGLNKNCIESFLEKFSFRKGETKRILSYIMKEKNLREKLKKKLKPSMVNSYLEPLSYEVILLLKAKSKNRILNKNIENFFKLYNNVRISIDGKDLKALGIKQGPCYQTIFKKLIQAKLDQNIKTKEEEINFVKKLIKK
ncbi:MAG: hypothetical protein N2Z79_04930, partial [Candidatus Omnitrophica bacterium]|nr:hypothetical protein [Candidatus Omnitrophota bacterium]